MNSVVLYKPYSACMPTLQSTSLQSPAKQTKKLPRFSRFSDIIIIFSEVRWY